MFGVLRLKHYFGQALVLVPLRISVPGPPVRLLRHALDAQRALYFAVIGSQAYKPQLRRHCANLLGTIRADLKQAWLGPLRTARQLQCLRQRAHDKPHWLRTNVKDRLRPLDVTVTTATAAHSLLLLLLYNFGVIPYKSSSASNISSLPLIRLMNTVIVLCKYGSY